MHCLPLHQPGYPPPPQHPQAGYGPPPPPQQQQQQQQVNVIVQQQEAAPTYVTVKEKSCLPDTTDWEWWQWTLAVLAVIILGPIVLAIGLVWCCLLLSADTD